MMTSSMLEALEHMIRPATERDLGALEWEGEYIRFRRLYRHAYREAEKGRRVILVAEAQGLLIGQIFINLHSNWRQIFPGEYAGYLHSFRVKPDFRNLGVGRSLISSAEQVLQAQSYQHAVISVAKSNEAALRLYQSLGYSIFKDDPGRWSFKDHENNVQHIVEPAFILKKAL